LEEIKKRKDEITILFPGELIETEEDRKLENTL